MNPTIADLSNGDLKEALRIQFQMVAETLAEIAILEGGSFRTHMSGTIRDIAISGTLVARKATP